MALTIADMAKARKAGERIAMVTCYDHASAMICARAGLRYLLVGDSLGQVMLGHPDTLKVTLADMVAHCASVARGAPDALIVADMPFLTYTSAADAVAAAGALMREGGAGAVKLEGGEHVLPIVRTLVDHGVPVMGHVGFTPQSAHTIGVRVQGRAPAQAAKIIRDAQGLEAAGAFGIVLELVPAELAAAITDRLQIPTIGIGAGAGCSGQVQVWHDLLGLFDRPPYRHARRYAELGNAIRDALAAYAADVAQGAFPTAANAVTMDAALVEEALALAERG